ncbi:MAG: histidinol phosphatase, partial [Ilumatobacter coccineus]
MTDLELALAAADLADRITLAGFEATDVSVGWKDDRSEVTEIDRQTETAIGDLITAERATHGFFGEEH